MALPVDGAKLPSSGILSYGFQRTPTHVHNGIDLPAPRGTLVRAAAPGTVIYANSEWRQGFTGYGRNVVIAHRDAWTLYAHLETVDVVPGQLVIEGQRIGTVGNSRFTAPGNFADNSGGTHLHFEASARQYPLPSDAKRLDPIAWLRDVHAAPPADIAEADTLPPPSKPGGRGGPGGSVVAFALLVLGAAWFAMRRLG